MFKEMFPDFLEQKETMIPEMISDEERTIIQEQNEIVRMFQQICTLETQMESFTEETASYEIKLQFYQKTKAELARSYFKMGQILEPFLPLESLYCYWRALVTTHYERADRRLFSRDDIQTEEKGFREESVRRRAPQFHFRPVHEIHEVRSEADKLSWFLVGLQKLTGIGGVERSEETALQDMIDLAKYKEYEPATYILGRVRLQEDHCPTINRLPIIEWIERDSLKGDILTRNLSAWVLLIAEKFGKTRDEKRACQLYKQNANAGDAVAQYQWGLETNNFDVICLSAEQGYAAAINYKGIRYQQEENYSEAFRCFWLAAKQGDPEACYNVGLSYVRGWGVKSDVKRGLEYYRKAAKKGCIQANAVLAGRYLKGEGVTQDKIEALRCCREAAYRCQEKKEWNETVLEKLETLYAEEAVPLDLDALKFIKKDQSLSEMLKVDIWFFLKIKLQNNSNDPLIQYCVWSILNPLDWLEVLVGVISIADIQSFITGDSSWSLKESQYYLECCQEIRTLLPLIPLEESFNETEREHLVAKYCIKRRQKKTFDIEEFLKTFTFFSVFILIKHLPDISKNDRKGFYVKMLTLFQLTKTDAVFLDRVWKEAVLQWEQMKNTELMVECLRYGGLQVRESCFKMMNEKKWEEFFKTSDDGILLETIAFSPSIKDTREKFTYLMQSLFALKNPRGVELLATFMEEKKKSSNNIQLELLEYERIAALFVIEQKTLIQPESQRQFLEKIERLEGLFSPYKMGFLLCVELFLIHLSIHSDEAILLQKLENCLPDQKLEKNLRENPLFEEFSNEIEKAFEKIINAEGLPDRCRQIVQERFIPIQTVLKQRLDAVEKKGRMQQIVGASQGRLVSAFSSIFGGGAGAAGKPVIPEKQDEESRVSASIPDSAL